MAWTTPATWTAGQVVGATDLNTHLRDNLNFLLGGEALTFVNSLVSHSTTSTTFTDIDATNLKITSTIKTGRVLLLAVIPSVYFSGGSAGTYPAFDIDCDGTRVGDSTYGLMVVGNTFLTVVLLAVKTGLSDASHTFKLQWRNGSSGQTVYTNYTTYNGVSVAWPITFVVHEL